MQEIFATGWLASKNQIKLFKLLRLRNVFKNEIKYTYWYLRERILFCSHSKDCLVDLKKKLKSKKLGLNNLFCIAYRLIKRNM